MVTITREEYLKALNVIAAYRQQIAELGKEFDLDTKSILLNDWIELPIVPHRLRYIFSQHLHFYNTQDCKTLHLEDIGEYKFMTMHRAGKKNWELFLSIRQKYYEQLGII